jgi:hypothetical protein
MIMATRWYVVAIECNEEKLLTNALARGACSGLLIACSPIWDNGREKCVSKNQVENLANIVQVANSNNIERIMNELAVYVARQSARKAFPRDFAERFLSDMQFFQQVGEKCDPEIAAKVLQEYVIWVKYVYETVTGIVGGKVGSTACMNNFCKSRLLGRRLENYKSLCSEEALSSETVKKILKEIYSYKRY